MIRQVFANLPEELTKQQAVIKSTPEIATDVATTQSSSSKKVSPKGKNRGQGKAKGKAKAKAKAKAAKKKYFGITVQFLENTRFLPSLQLFDAIWRVIFFSMRHGWKGARLSL